MSEMNFCIPVSLCKYIFINFSQWNGRTSIKYNAESENAKPK